MALDFNFDFLADNNEVDKLKAKTETEASTIVAPVVEEPVLSVVPSPAAPVVPVEDPNATILSPEDNDYIAKINALQTPAPVYDASREKRLQTMAGAGGVAKALMTLGDAFALSKGGIVPRRQMSDQDPYVAQILADRQIFRDKEYAASLQKNADELRKAAELNRVTTVSKERDFRQNQAELDQINKEIDRAVEEKRYDDAKMWKEKEMDLRNKQFEWDKELGQKTLNQRGALGYANIEADKERYANRAQEQTGSKGKYVVFGPGGTKVDLNDSSTLTTAYNLLMKDPALQNEPALSKRRTLESVTPEGDVRNMLPVVAEYWGKSPAVQGFLKEQGLLTEAPAPEVTGKVGTLFTTPQQ